MIKLFHQVNATLPTGRRKRNGIYKMASFSLKLAMKKKNNYLRMELGCSLIKREKFKTVRFTD